MISSSRAGKKVPRRQGTRSKRRRLAAERRLALSTRQKWPGVSGRWSWGWGGVRMNPGRLPPAVPGPGRRPPAPPHPPLPRALVPAPGGAPSARRDASEARAPPPPPPPPPPPFGEVAAHHDVLFKEKQP